MESVIVYQIKKDAPDARIKLFESYDVVDKYFGKVDMNDYEVVYVGQQEAKTLDDVFFIFNMIRPSDFKGHSLSVSDIVWFKGKMWYCDSFGWKEVK